MKNAWIMAAESDPDGAEGDFLIRGMYVEDIPAVLAIDRASFPNPWPESTYRYELLENRVAHVLVVIDRSSAEVIGVAGYWLVVDEAHISTFAVRPDWRNRGVGAALLLGLLREAAELGATSALLEVRAGNGPAQALYRRFGFRKVGRRKGYYKDNGEDALLMNKDHLESMESPERRKDTL
jgi:[ribosomal protein S18]-alanine N-acetyltransferase